MATIAQRILVKDARVTEDENGLAVVEPALIVNCDPNNPLYDAMNVTGLPRYGDYHDTIPDLVVKSRVARAFLNANKTDTVVEITYRAKDFGFQTPADAPRVKFTAFTREVQTSKYNDGTPIIVKYLPTASSSMSTTLKQKVGKITDIKAMGTLEFDFVKASDPSYLLNYFGRVNNAPWRGGAKYTWHFADLSIEKQKYNPWWNVHASFVYDPETFVKTAFFTDKDGNIPFDIDQPIDPYVNEGTDHYGWANVLIATDANFLTLGLPSGF